MEYRLISYVIQVLVLVEIKYIIITKYCIIKNNDLWIENKYIVLVIFRIDIRTVQ